MRGSVTQSAVTQERYVAKARVSLMIVSSYAVEQMRRALTGHVSRPVSTYAAPTASAVCAVCVSPTHVAT